MKIGANMDSSSDQDSTPPGSPKHKKVKKGKHVDSKYQSEWFFKYRMKSSKKGHHFAFCTVCNMDFSVAGGGVHQVKRHCQNKKHTTSMQELSGHPTIQEALMSSQAQAVQKFRDQVTCAELYFARLLLSTTYLSLLLTTSIDCVQ